MKILKACSLTALVICVLFAQVACGKNELENNSIGGESESMESVTQSMESQKESTVPVSSSSVDNTTAASQADDTTAATTSSSAVTLSPLDKILDSLSGEDRDCSSYDIEKYMQPYWEGNVVYNESVLFIANQDGTIDSAPLMYTADKILSVRNYALSTQYVEGVDWELDNGMLKVLPGSSIPVMDYDQYYLSQPVSGASFERVGGGYIAFSETPLFHKAQIVVTYVHTSEWSGPVPAYSASILPKTIEKLKNNEKLNILFYGDSITTGANSSAYLKCPPYAISWDNMTVCTLIRKYSNTNITYVNTAVGGKDSNWGAQNAQALASDKSPDLAVIAFGMNDGSLKPEAFKANIQSIMNTIKAGNPDCEFILVATMLPNSEVVGFDGQQKNFWSVLGELEQEGVAMANITELHEELLKYKRYYDMTGNNVNHPNDFLARLYAQTLVAMLSE